VLGAALLLCCCAQRRRLIASSARFRERWLLAGARAGERGRRIRVWARAFRDNLLNVAVVGAGDRRGACAPMRRLRPLIPARALEWRCARTASWRPC
jgi:hypothetical protein